MFFLMAIALLGCTFVVLCVSIFEAFNYIVL